MTNTEYMSSLFGCAAAASSMIAGYGIGKRAELKKYTREFTKEFGNPYEFKRDEKDEKASNKLNLIYYTAGSAETLIHLGGTAAVLFGGLYMLSKVSSK